MKSIIASSVALGLLAGSAMAQSFSFNGVLTPVGSKVASGSFTGSFTPSTGALTISGTTFYTTGSLGASTGTPLTSGTISPGPASVTVNPGSNNSVLFLDLGIAGQVFANTRTQTFSGMGTVAINVQQTITLSDANGPVLTGTFTPVPEPETYAAVAALGLVGFGLWRRRNA